MKTFKFIATLAAVLLGVGCRPQPAKFDPIVKEIQTGALSIPTNGPVRLPPRFHGVTPRDEIFVERKADGRLFVLFPTWYGREEDIEGLLYCSRAPLPSD